MNADSKKYQIKYVNINKKPWLWIIPPFLLTIITILFYLPSLKYSFQFDDMPNILKYFDIRFASFSDLFFKNSRWISKWLNTIFFKFNRFEPYAYRVGNLSIHILGGLILFYFLLSALNRLNNNNFFKNNAFAISFLTSILFLLHPVQTQTVSYVIQGQLEGLSAVFILAMLLTFLKMHQTNSKILSYTLGILLVVLALLSCGTKEIAIVSPALILLTDWFFIAQGNWNSFKRRIIIHLIILVIILSTFIYFLKPKFFADILGLKLRIDNNIGNAITLLPNEKIHPLNFFISEFKVILHYIWIFIWPFGICVDYDWKLSYHFFAPDSFIPFWILIGLAFLTYKIIKKNKSSLIAFGILWFFICILPRSSFIPSAELMADYKTYLASAGLLLIISAFLIKIFELCSQKYKYCNTAFNNIIIQTGIMILLSLILGFLTYQRNKVWRSGLEFWGDMINKGINKARVHNNYGVELSYKKEFRKAISHFKKAIKMDYNYPDPCNNLAIAYSTLGKLDLAIKAYQQSIKIHPRYPEVYNNIANLFLQKKEFDKAEQALNIALKLRPHYGKAYLQKGKLYLEKGDNEKAFENFKNCCTKADLDNEIGFQFYAAISMKLKKYEDAIYAYQKIIELNPNILENQFNLANAYFFTKNYNKALDIYNFIQKKRPNDKRNIYNIGETYFMMKRPEKALNYFMNAINQIPYANIRTAECLIQLGENEKAKNQLNNILISKMPANIIDLAKKLLSKLDNQPKICYS